MKAVTRKVLRQTMLVLASGFVLAQFVRPERTNPPVAAGATLQSRLQPPADVERLLTVACNDCHSHESRWPWYSHVAPVSWLVWNDVREGRKHANFSRFGEHDRGKQTKILEEAAEEVAEGKMPPRIYELTHPDARLSADERRTLSAWFSSAASELDPERRRGRSR
jgi:hypothetical protein